MTFEVECIDPGQVRHFLRNGLARGDSVARALCEQVERESCVLIVATTASPTHGGAVVASLVGRPDRAEFVLHGPLAGDSRRSEHDQLARRLLDELVGAWLRKIRARPASRERAPRRARPLRR